MRAERAKKVGQLPLPLLLRPSSPSPLLLLLLLFLATSQSVRIASCAFNVGGVQIGASPSPPSSGGVLGSVGGAISDAWKSGTNAGSSGGQAISNFADKNIGQPSTNVYKTVTSG